MSRQRRKSSFSFTKFFDLIIPDLFDDYSAPRAAALAPFRRDMLYGHQVASTNFYALDEQSFAIAGIVDSKSMSKRVYNALHKCKILKEGGIVDTTQIGPRFIHQMSFIDVSRQRELINLLYHWQEECQRFKKLTDEYEELEESVKKAELCAAQDADDVGKKEALDKAQFAREWTRMKIRQGPSERRTYTESNTFEGIEIARKTMSAPVLSQQGGTALENGEQLPLYGSVRKR
jgi:hypothetical protein